MQLHELDYDPRPDASKQVAAAKRARQQPDQDEQPARARVTLTPRQLQVILGIGAVLFVGALALMGSWSRPLPPAAPTTQPTEELRALSAPPTPRPAPTSAPQPTIAPTAIPAPVAPALAVPAQSGRGLGQAPPVEQQPTYLEVVAAQAPHSPRGDGQRGPSGGDWVAVPPISEAQAEVIRQQAPHKVR